MSNQALTFNTGGVVMTSIGYYLLASDGLSWGAKLTAGINNPSTYSYNIIGVNTGTAIAIKWVGTYSGTVIETEEAFIVASSGSGSGANLATVTVTDGASVLQAAIVAAYTGAGVLAGFGTTDASGNVTLSLATGSYDVSVVLSGYTFVAETRTVTGNETGTLVSADLAMTATVIPSAPADPSKATLYGYVKLGTGTNFSGQTVTVTLQGKGPFFVATSAVLIEATSHTATTIADGSWSITDVFGSDVISDADGREVTEWQVTCGPLTRRLRAPAGVSTLCTLSP